MRIALAIAASDPTGGAGLQADLQVLRRFGVHGAGVVTALTVQDTAKVHSVLPVFPSVVLDQLRALLADLTPHAVKIGALASDDVLRNVALGLESLDEKVPIVLDPILFSSSGAPLLERRAWGSLTRLFERCALVTPNWPEAEALSGVPISDRASAEAAARTIVEELGAGAVLVKGGHGSSPEGPGAVEDLLGTRDRAGALRLEWYVSDRKEVGPVHGTGCALSSAIAACLARGTALVPAIVEARAFVADSLEASEAPGGGARLLGLT